MWASLSDEELLQKSDLIGMGEWQGETDLLLADKSSHRVGVISVSEVLKGAAATTVVLVSVPAPKALRSSSDLVYRRGDRGLWLLRSRPDNTSLHLADHPQRFVPASGGEERIKQLRRQLTR